MALLVTLKVSSSLETDFRICFYPPAWRLYWPDYIWGCFSSSKVILRQPLHLPKKLLMGSMDWLMVGLTCMLHDSLCSIDTPKHVYHCVCCSKMTLLFPTCANTAVKKWCMASIPSQECRQRAHTLWLTHSQDTHILFWISAVISGLVRREENCKWTHITNKAKPGSPPKLLCTLNLWTTEAPASSVAS